MTKPTELQLIAAINAAITKHDRVNTEELAVIEDVDQALKSADAHTERRIVEIMDEHGRRRERIAGLAHELAARIGRLPGGPRPVEAAPTMHDDIDNLMPRIARAATGAKR